MNKSTLEILVAARALISDERNWCKGDYVIVRDHGYAFCSVGALNHVAIDEEVRNPAVIALCHAIGSGDLGIPSFNDSSTHAEVLDLFDRAILAERAKLPDLTPQVHAIIDSALTAAADPVQRERVLQYGSV